jgi:ABC-type transport system involved in cytochrome c biogenesis permease subunit
MNSFLLYLSFGSYLTAGLLYLLNLVLEKPSLAKGGARLTFAAWILNTVLLGLFFARAGYPFLVDSTSSYLFTAWAAAALFLVLNMKYRFQLVGVFVLPLISLFYLLAMFSFDEIYARSGTLTQSPWASVHILLSFLAFAILSLSFVLAIIFIIEDFQLKHKVLPKIFMKLPSLQVVEQIHARALGLGFILLSGGIVSGAIWAKTVTGVYFFEDARQLWAICAWLIYAFFLQARLAAGWRGRKGILLSILGFLVIVFTFVGVRHS